jgi:foldase protein PrsA
MAITRSAVEHRMEVDADSGSPSEDVVPVAPGFTGCIAHMQAYARSSKSGRLSRVAAKAQCAELYGQQVENALQSLISDAWVKGWAQELGVHVSDREVRRETEREVTEQFRTEAKLRRFMRDSGETIPDLLSHKQERLLEEGIRDKVNAKIGPVTNAMIDEYYAENQAKYHVNEQRYVRIVVTKRGAVAAAQLKRELEHGVSYAAVAKRLEAEQLPIFHHGEIKEGLEPRSLGRTSLDRTVFTARPGLITGPVDLDVGPGFEDRSEQDIKDIDGYYIFTVTHITPAGETPLAQVKRALALELPTLLEKQELAKLIAKLRSKWRAITSCVPGYVVLKCRQYKPAPGERPEDPYTLD